jgi:prevent-host-death family protein
MSERPLTPISVADVKRRFADVLGAVRYRGERFVVERNGTPMAALVPLPDVLRSEPAHPHGFLALVGAFDDTPDFPAAVNAAYQTRRAQRTRPVPRLKR